MYFAIFNESKMRRALARYRFPQENLSTHKDKLL